MFMHTVQYITVDYFSVKILIISKIEFPIEIVLQY